MRNRRAVVILVGVCCVCGCVSVEKDFKRACATDTVKAYDGFIDLHPSSEYTRDARRKIQDLEKEESDRKERVRQLRLDSIGKIQRYSIGITTENDFINDGWGPHDTEVGSIGICLHTIETGVTTIFLGYATGKLTGDEYRSMVLFSAMARQQGVEFSMKFDATRRAITLCRLQFKEGMLKRMSFDDPAWNNLIQADMVKSDIGK